MGIRKFLQRIIIGVVIGALVLASGVVTPVEAIGEACPTPFVNTTASNIDYNSQLVKANDGAMWVKKTDSKIARITNSGTTEFAIPSTTGGITAGADGNIWFTSINASQLSLSSITSSGTVTSTPVSINSVTLHRLVQGSDGAFWGVGRVQNQEWFVERIATDGTATQYPINTSPATPNAQILSLVSGSDGNIWLTYDGNGIAALNQIVRVNSTTGAMTWFSWGAQTDIYLRSMTVGADGAFWYTLYNSATNDNYLGRMATDGTATEIHDSRLTGVGAPNLITTGADGNLWFTAGNGVGRFTPGTQEVENFNFIISMDYPSMSALASSNDAIWLADPGLGTMKKLDLAALPGLATPREFTTSIDPYQPQFTWQAVSGATSYSICKNGTVIDTSSTASYNDTTAAENEHNYYTIVANSSSGQSSPAVGIELVVNRLNPTLTPPSFTANPLLHGQTSVMSVDATDANGIYGVRMTVDGGSPIELHKACIGVGCSTPTDTWEAVFSWTGDNPGGSCGIGCQVTSTQLDDGVHTIVVTSIDSMGRQSTPQTATITVGLVPPTGLSVAQSPTKNAPVLNWTGIVGADHYVIYRDGNATPIGTSVTPTYTDTAALADGTHTYTVATADASNTVSAQSAPVSVVVDKTIPTVSNPAVTPAVILSSGTLSISANAADVLSGVSSGEYYIDTDPGQGNGTPMTYSSSTGKISATRSVSSGSFSRGGHTIHMRAKDAAGNWSATVSRNFVYL